MFFYFKQKTAYEMRISDWSSDVCSSDLVHTDHWDQTAAETIPASLPIFVQHFGDKALISRAGYVSLDDGAVHHVEGKTFSDVRVLTGNPEFNDRTSVA